jgi:hypothetical protein
MMPSWQQVDRSTADALGLEHGTQPLERTADAADDLGQAIEELWRMTPPGSTIVVLEPDWDTLVIDAGPLAATRAVCRAVADATPNPAGGRQIARRLRKLGATDVQVEPRSAALTDLADADRRYGLTNTATATLAPAAARAWINTLQERDEQGAFLAALTYFLVSATRPAV